MDMAAMKCPECGKEINVPVITGKLKCRHCGAALFFSEDDETRTIDRQVRNLELDYEKKKLDLTKASDKLEGLFIITCFALLGYVLLIAAMLTP